VSDGIPVDGRRYRSTDTEERARELGAAAARDKIPRSARPYTYLRRRPLLVAWLQGFDEARREGRLARQQQESRPKRKPKRKAAKAAKTTGRRISSIAGRVLQGHEPTEDEAKSMAASLLSQDEPANGGKE
jgi:hypothetical protein